MKLPILPLLVAVAAFPASSQSRPRSAAPAPYVPGAIWEHRSPAAMGVDSVKLADAIAFAIRTETRPRATWR